VIPIHHAGEEDGQLFLVMDLVEGSDLRELLARHGPMPVDRAVRIFEQVAGALDAAHARGLVHRDIKPANILVEEATDHPYLTDFGLSKSTTSAGGLTQTGQWLGTVDYVAPEQILGSSTDARTDVYALGCLLFHMLTAEVPFRKEGDAAKLWAHMNDEPPSLRAVRPDVPPEVEAVVRRAMAKNPDDRQPSAATSRRPSRPR
jgi:serine/threonine protein kinase